jgi:hypothetical protein
MIERFGRVYLCGYWEWVYDEDGLRRCYIVDGKVAGSVSFFPGNCCYDAQWDVWMPGDGWVKVDSADDGMLLVEDSVAIAEATRR